jgi:death-on-curing protein
MSTWAIRTPRASATDDHGIHVAERTLGEVLVRDHGLLESALARPRTSLFGDDAYPSIEGKAAALLHSLARHRALVDGNERLALAGTVAFLGANGRRLTLSTDEAYELVMSVATGEVDDVAAIAARLTGESVRFWHVSPPPS